MATGTIKIRAKEKGGEVEVKVLFTHPMETGMRKDKATGANKKVIKADKKNLKRDKADLKRDKKDLRKDKKNAKE